MIKIIIIIIGLYFIYKDLIYVLKFLFLYQKASKEWETYTGKVISIKAYPRSFGIVPTVEIQYENNIKIIEVFKVYFSSNKIGQVIEVLIDNKNIEICIVMSKILYLKNILLVIVLFLLFFTVIGYLMSLVFF